jgi:lipopolysaccharide transport system permease protein
MFTNSSIENQPVTKIRPPKRLAAFNLRELWEYRELIYFLIWRDIKVRYKQTAIGAAWAILQPFLTMVVFSIIFGQLIRVQTGGAPYPVFSYAALLPWMLFAAAVGRSGSSLIYDANLVSKVYFPRVILPLSATLSNLVDFGLAFTILLGMMAVFGIHLRATFLTLPLFLLLAVVAALAVGLWLAALNTKYRDINYVIPFLIQFWLFVTPVAYSSAIIPERWRLLYSLNPMVAVIEGFRWALLGQQNLSWDLMLCSILLTLALAVSGWLFFRRMEFEFADIV